MLKISIVGSGRAILRGTERGNPTHERIIQRPWVWAPSKGAWVLPVNLKPDTRDRRIAQLVARAQALSVPVIEVEGELPIGELISKINLKISALNTYCNAHRYNPEWDPTKSEKVTEFRAEIDELIKQRAARLTAGELALTADHVRVGDVVQIAYGQWHDVVAVGKKRIRVRPRKIHGYLPCDLTYRGPSLIPFDRVIKVRYGYGS